MKAVSKSRVLDKGLWGMSGPMFIDQAVLFTIPMVDMFFLSRISDDAAAAVGAVAPLVYVANQFLTVSAFAGAAIASQRIGANDYERGNATIAAYTLFAIAMALLAALTVNWGGPFVASKMSLTPSSQEAARLYLSIIGWMVAVWGCRVVYQTILNIYGEPQWNTISNLIIFSVNIAGNYVAIYGIGSIPPTGVAGVAVAGIVAAASGLLFLLLIVHWRLKIVIPIKQGIKQFSTLIWPVLLIAGPSILEPMSFQAYMITLNFIAADVSDVALKLKIYTFNILLFCLMISIAISMATEAIISQRVGRGEFDLVSVQLKQSLRAALIGCCTLASAWWIFHEEVMEIFTDDPRIIALAGWAFFLSLIAEPFRTINIVIGSALRCTGDAAFSSISSIAAIWLFSVPLAYVLAIVFEWGIWGILTAAILDEAIRSGIKVWRWRQGVWRTKGVNQREARNQAARKL